MHVAPWHDVGPVGGLPGLVNVQKAFENGHLVEFPMKNGDFP